ncbi:hypothetical protein [Streptomyces sp. NPDC058751]|uniref:hypothetical protein n=1 Tax=Streptomyces sp. NPDC058751 TaxID=3346623 RepID=UPI0036CED1FA
MSVVPGLECLVGLAAQPVLEPVDDLRIRRLLGRRHHLTTADAHQAAVSGSHGSGPKASQSGSSGPGRSYQKTARALGGRV